MTMKNKTRLPSGFALLLFAAFALPAWNATAQDTKSVAGTYTPVLSAQFGDNARGQMILGSDGRYSIILARAMLPKIAAGARDKGTAEENKAIVGGSIFHYGKYMVDREKQTITFNVEASSYPNWDGSVFKRTLKVSGDQLTYTNVAPSNGGPAQDVVWKRVK
jgi:Lipocalin-like domain